MKHRNNRRILELRSGARLMFLGLCGAVIAGCATQARHVDHPYFHKTESGHAARWTYDGESGPDHWGDLNEAYIAAKTGKQQSPIDLRDPVPTDLPELTFDYRPSRIHLVYNGHTIQENEDPGSFVSAGGRRFELQQLHFHSPSEHTVEGRQFPMELHLVHKADDGTISVVAVFIEAGGHNHAFDPIWNNLPDQARPSRDRAITVNAISLLPKRRTYFAYDGSFTTPPCTEGVRWVVMTEPVAISHGQIAQFRRVICDNNRPIQPINNRIVHLSN